MMLYKNTKAIVCSPDRHANFFGILNGVLQRDRLVPYLFILFLVNKTWTSEDLLNENDFTLKRKDTNDITQKQWQRRTT